MDIVATAATAVAVAVAVAVANEPSAAASLSPLASLRGNRPIMELRLEYSDDFWEAQILEKLRCSFPPKLSKYFVARVWP